MRFSVASAANDHRLGANEAPPAIISIFIGDELDCIIDSIINDTPLQSCGKTKMSIGATVLPHFSKDATDRNRTSPFAFTGNKFEFRAVGSNQSCAGSNVVLNTIVTEALDEICTRLEADVKAGKDFNVALQAVLSGIIKKHKRILFNGDNYTGAWAKEAEKRGLPNVKKTPEALEALTTPKASKLFSKYGVLTEKELHSRYEIYKETYEKVVEIEAGVMITMAKTMFIPAIMAAQGELAATIETVKVCKGKTSGSQAMLKAICDETEALFKAVAVLEKAHGAAKLIAGMGKVRASVDALEKIVPQEFWPIPSYAEMLFMM
jgi:glutamine synthetase